MENEFELENRENFRINPQVWLHTLLAIAGDKDKKAEVVAKVARATGMPPEKVEVIMATTISILINQTRAN
jgi:hypothetical protein